MQQCAIIITQYKKYYICKFKLLKNDKFCNNPLKPHCSAPCIEPHHQFIPLWGAEGITDATGATCSPHWIDISEKLFSRGRKPSIHVHIKGYMG